MTIALYAIIKRILDPRFIFCLTIFGTTAIFACPEGPNYGDCVKMISEKIYNPQPQTLDSLTDGNFELFRLPNQYHSRGIMHSAIYRTWHFGKPFLIKIVGGKNGMSEQDFKQELYGMLLASQIGGPQVASAGRFVDGSGGDGFYLQMEEITSRNPTVTLKGLFFGTTLPLADPKLQMYLTANHAKWIAKLFVMAINRNIQFHGDFDMVLTTSSVHWIDSAGWSSNSKRLEQAALEGYADALDQFYQILPKFGLQIKAEFKAEVLSSDSLNQNEKDRYLRIIDRRMEENLNYRIKGPATNQSKVRSVFNKICRSLTGKL